jgi:hypothetical protein
MTLDGWSRLGELEVGARVTNAAKHFGVTAKRDDYPVARVTTLRLAAVVSPTKRTSHSIHQAATILNGILMTNCLLMPQAPLAEDVTSSPR